MNRGWVVKYKDSQDVVSEWTFDRPFSQLPRQDMIEAVALVFDQRSWVFANKRGYFSAKGEAVVFSNGRLKADDLVKALSITKYEAEHVLSQFPEGISSFRYLVNRSIGFVENDKRVMVTFNERTGEMRGPYYVHES